jgi:hypothetical protein
MNIPVTSEKTALGSYTVCDPPFDTYGSTTVPLRTPHGPVTLHVTDDSHVYADSSYRAREYDSGPSLNATVECFTWKGADVIGSANFYADTGWMPKCDEHFSGRGRNITAKMTAEIIAHWSAVITRYMTENPLIPVHAGFRAQVLGKKSAEIRKTTEVLAALRADHARLRRAVRQALAAERTLREPGGMNEPRPYADYQSHYASGYVVELEQDAARKEHDAKS